MTYFPSHEELGEHPKTKRATRLLEITCVQMVGHLSYLYWWALHYAPDGDVTRYENVDLAEAARWEGDPNTFVHALTNCGIAAGTGFLEQTEDGRLLIHDWYEYGGKVIQARERHAEYVRNTRAKSHDEHEIGGDNHIPTRDNHVIVTEQSRECLDKIRIEESKEEKNKKELRPAKAVAASFDFQLVWSLSETLFGYKPSWTHSVETNAIKDILKACPRASPAELVAFLAYKRTCFGVDPNSQVKFSKYRGDFAPWYNNGMPTQQEVATNGKATNGNGRRFETTTERDSRIIRERFGAGTPEQVGAIDYQGPRRIGSAPVGRPDDGADGDRLARGPVDGAHRLS